MGICITYNYHPKDYYHLMALTNGMQIDAEIVKELFPEDEELYNKIKNMTNKMYKTTYNLNKNNRSNKDSSTKEKNEPKTEIKNN